MTTYKRYFKDLHRGAPLYRCSFCHYDSFAEANIKLHVESHAYHLYMPSDFAEAIVLAQTSAEPIMGRHVVLGIITSQTDWPTRSVILARLEAHRLRQLGLTCTVFWVDNGSQITHTEQPDVILATNEGQSIARNHIIDKALALRADYLVMLDGDIEVITLSVIHLLRSLYEGRRERIGCVGLHSRNCTSDRTDGITQYGGRLGIIQPRPNIAWTQYGAFDCQVFMDGVRFDTSPCFAGPGWGFEDDDLVLQMMDRGYTSVNCPMYRYGHFSMHSSVRKLDREVIAKAFRWRRYYVYDKWKASANPGIQAHIHRLINQTFPVLT